MLRKHSAPQDEDRHTAAADHFCGGAADEKLEEAGVTVGSHDEKIDLVGGDFPGTDGFGVALHEEFLGIEAARSEESAGGVQGRAVFVSGIPRHDEITGKAPQERTLHNMPQGRVGGRAVIE